MNNIEMMKALSVPTGMVDVVLDTDTYNEIDDQFALAYLLKSTEKLNCKAIYAAPFFNDNSTSPEDGMLKSYDEILKVLDFMGLGEMRSCVYKGSTSYLPDEKTPVISDAAADLVKRASGYSKENPLYVVAIGAITNVASAIIMDKSIIDKIVIVWLGGHALYWHDNNEFNLRQDVAAARVIFGCGAPFVQLPCCGVVSGFATTKPELESCLVGTTPIGDYLATNTIRYMQRYCKEGYPWSKVIWDVTAVAWLLNDNGRFMRERIIHAPIPQYDHHYSLSEDTHFMKYVYAIHRDALFADMVEKLTK